MNCSYPFFVKKYFVLMDSEPHRFCKHQFALRKLIDNSFKTDNVYVDEEQAVNYFGLSKYLGFEQIYEWEEFVLGLHLCTYWKDTGMPRWPDLLCFIGRGAGKDGVISIESMALSSHYNPIMNYDVDICANNEDQATRPVKDLIEGFDRNEKKLKKYYHWTQERIKCKKTGSYIKGHTNNAKGKDGLRSGVVIFNEYHAYENYANINVFTTGLGKKPHPRRSIFTTNGNVIDGPLDELLKDCDEILFNGAPDNGMLPFICCLDSKEEVDNEENWHKANPSLRYKPDLMNEIRKEYLEWKTNPARLPDFMTKRMNLRESNNELAVTTWENLDATKHIYDESLKGRDCICGIDFTKTTDWAAVNLHFKDEDKRIDINHAWICMQSPELHRLKCPYKDWAKKGHLDMVYDAEVNPILITDYIYQMSKIYRIKFVCLDSYRYALLRDYLEKIGFSLERKNIMLVRPSDIMKVYPIIDRCFTNKFFYWGEQPHLRWATNNTKLVRAKKSKLAKDGELDIGNFLFGKIEPKSRKTDPFMSLVHSMCAEDKLAVRRKPSKARKHLSVTVYS
mgnify:CR=1 FL=1